MSKLLEPRYSLRETADILRVTVRTLRRWMKPETAPGKVALVPNRLGGRLYYTEDLIAEWQRQCELKRERARKRGQRA